MNGNGSSPWAWVVFLLIVVGFVLAISGNATPDTGALSEDLALAQGKIQRATVNANATANARANAAFAADATLSAAIRRADATATAQSRAATAQAQSDAATVRAAIASATLAAVRAQQTASAMEVAEANKARDAKATRDAQYEAIALEREKAWTATQGQLVGVCAVAGIVVTTAAAFVWSQRAKAANKPTISTAPTPSGGTIASVPQGHHMMLVPPVLPPPATTTQTTAQPARAEIITMPEAKPYQAVPAAPVDPNVALALALLDESIAHFGADSNRIKPAWKSALGGETWEAATRLLSPYVLSGKTRAGTRIVSPDYPTLAALRDAVESGAAALHHENQESTI